MTNDGEKKERKRPDSFQAQGSKRYRTAYYTLQITFLAIVWFQTIIPMGQTGQTSLAECLEAWKHES